jgi:hypothetical protein
MLEKEKKLKDKFKPLIDSTYPAIMAGLCLTSLGLNQVISCNSLLQPILSLASFLFIASSACIFAHSVAIGRGINNDKVMEDKVTIFWKIAKWSYFYGICLLLAAILLVNFYLLGSVLRVLGSVAKNFC